MAEGRARRTMLITPGHQPARMAKAVGLAADSVVFDLEDGVPADQKPTARQAASDALRSLDFGERERVVRINAARTAAAIEDIRALPLALVDALMVPKVESAGEVGALERVLKGYEAMAGCAPVALILTIETADGLFRCRDIAQASQRTEALFFGSGDYAAETGARITPDTLGVPRALIAAAAGSAGHAAIDAAYFVDVKDAEATRQDALIACDLGFSGKLVFHPNQIGPVNEVFTPTPQDTARAAAIVEAYRDARARGEGVAVVDGAFIAIDTMRMAERIVAAARRAGVLTRSNERGQ